MVIVYTRDGKSHEYPTATHSAPYTDGALVGVVNVFRIANGTADLLAWFERSEVQKVEFFARVAGVPVEPEAAVH